MRVALFTLAAASLCAQVSVGFRPAPLVELPGHVDSNSPAIRWRGQLVVFTSDNTPKRSAGPDLAHLVGPEVVRWRGPQISRWIEAAWVDDDDSIYAWYHHEPTGVCPGDQLTSPMIGAAISQDGGFTFTDLGFVLRAAEAPNCAARNGFFSGGHGDFSVLLDQDRDYFYFVFTSYGGEAASQGLGLARLPFASRSNPAGLVHKYHAGEWLEPGLHGRITPILPPPTGWETGQPLAYWGPSLHWNYAVNSYVMLLNRTCCQERWPQEGIYLSFNSQLDQPAGWSEPTLLTRHHDWYPQVIGVEPGGTSDRAGTTTRFFVRGTSTLELVFWPSPEEDESETISDYYVTDRARLAGANRHGPAR